MKNINKKRFIIKLGLLFLLTACTAVNKQSDESSAYRMDNYRSETPEALAGATVVDAEAAKRLHEDNKVYFIDVLPAPKKPDALSDSDVWLPKKRFNIPSSIWLADVGYGVLSDQMERYFKNNLKLLTHSSDKGLLFYCLSDCWMSWNAAKRALAYGYDEVYWFPGGTDEWTFNDFELELAEPKAY